MSGPVVRLITCSSNPYDLSVASARTCYSSSGVVLPEDVSRTESARQLRDKIARSTLQAGHLTTRGHAFFVFAIDRISRAAIWSFLHSHPFYNSEQVSQRYVEVKPNSFHIPKLNEKQRAIYEKTLDLQLRGYQKLCEIMIPAVEAEFFARFPARRNQKDKWTKTIARYAYEVARYLLPIATYALMYHTINGVTLHRYARLAEMLDFPSETSILVRRMIDAVSEVDPDFADELDDPVPLEETPEFKLARELFQNGWRIGDKKFVDEFDEAMNGGLSVLVDFSGKGEKLLADSARVVMGLRCEDIDDDSIIRHVLDPAQNNYFGDHHNLGYNSHLMRSMHHVHYVFAKKLSHTADSQEQRHRTVPETIPTLFRHYTGYPDYLTPLLIRSSDEAVEFYDRAMREIFENINRLLDAGTPIESAMYLLPNAFPIRFFESGSLIGFHHKWRMRLCFNAQEEIFRSALEEVTQVARVHPRIGQYLRPPCWFRARADLSPPCPEGDRFCGVKVWELDPTEYNRLI